MTSTTATVTVPRHETGERLSIQLFTVEGTSLGPYVALPLASLWTPYSGHLFTRETAEKIVTDLHREDADCGLSAEWGDDGTLTFTWTDAYDGEGGSQVIRPDAHGRYEIGDLWAWDEWQETTPQTQAQRLIAAGAWEYRGADRSLLFPPAAAALYAMGRLEAHRVTLHLDDAPEVRMRAALAEYGISAVTDTDGGNTWLEIPFDQDADYDGVGPGLVAYVEAPGTEGVFVDEPMNGRRGTWTVNIADGNGPARTVFTCDAEDFAAAADFIADRLTRPTA